MRAFSPSPELGNLLYHRMPGAGVPVVYLHGLGCASSCDYPTIAADPALEHRPAILVDLLGFGFSDRPEAFGYRVEDHAETVAALVRHLGLVECDLFGHSMGGAVAIAAATLLGDRVRRLVLSEPNLDPGGGLFSSAIAAMSEADYVAHGHAETVAGARAGESPIWAASAGRASPLALHRGATSLVEGSDPTWRAQLYALPMPKTLIFGEATLPDPDWERLPRDGVSVDMVTNAGHSMAWENPAGVAAAIARALA